MSTPFTCRDNISQLIIFHLAKQAINSSVVVSCIVGGPGAAKALQFQVQRSPTVMRFLVLCTGQGESEFNQRNGISHLITPKSNLTRYCEP